METQKKSFALFVTLTALYAILSLMSFVMSYANRVSVQASTFIEWAAAALTLLAIAFTGLRRKVPALTLSIINLVVAVFMFFGSALQAVNVLWLMYNADTLIYVAAGVLILLYTVGVMKNTQVLTIVFLAMAGTVLLMNIVGFFYFVTTLRFGVGWSIGYAFRSMPYDLSRVCLYGAMALGVQCFTPNLKQIVMGQ